MSSFLEEVTAARRADAKRRRGEGALDRAQAAAQAARPPRDFHAALTKHGMSLIAEIKRASPSAGAIAPDADILALARAYVNGGASAISVLTEPDHFRGSLDDLSNVRDAVDLPVLRKDFICDELQVWEARAADADAVLLIVAALTQDELVALGDLTASLGMSALVETHDDAEVARALEADARIVGINTRNLATLEVDPAMVAKLRDDIPADVTVVGESGVKTRADVAAMEAIGVDAVLVGETLMRAADPAATIRELLGG